MLVLTVPAGQTVKVGNIEIKILESGKTGTRIGFSGDRSIPIIRENAKQQTKRNN